MTFLVSTDGPPEEWWQIANRLTDDFIEASLSSPEQVEGAHDYLRTANLVYGLSLDQIESIPLRNEIIRLLRHGADQLIFRNQSRSPSSREIYEQLITILDNYEKRVSTDI